MKFIDKIKETISELEKTGFITNRVTGKCGKGKNSRKFKTTFNATSLITGETKNVCRIINWM
jgi:hypothetical protein